MWGQGRFGFPRGTPTTALSNALSQVKIDVDAINDENSQHGLFGSGDAGGMFTQV